MPVDTIKKVWRKNVINYEKKLKFHIISEPLKTNFNYIFIAVRINKNHRFFAKLYQVGRIILDGVMKNIRIHDLCVPFEHPLTALSVKYEAAKT